MTFEYVKLIFSAAHQRVAIHCCLFDEVAQALDSRAHDDIHFLFGKSVGFSGIQIEHKQTFKLMRSLDFIVLSPLAKLP
jgi:hypothetical protein